MQARIARFKKENKPDLLADKIQNLRAKNTCPNCPPRIQIVKFIQKGSWVPAQNSENVRF